MSVTGRFMLIITYIQLYRLSQTGSGLYLHNRLVELITSNTPYVNLVGVWVSI